MSESVGEVQSPNRDSTSAFAAAFDHAEGASPWPGESKGSAEAEARNGRKDSGDKDDGVNGEEGTREEIDDEDHAAALKAKIAAAKYRLLA